MASTKKPLPLLWLARFPMPILQENSQILEWIQFFLVPPLQKLETHPSIRCSLLVSGELLDFLSQFNPEILKLLQVLHERGQIEMIGDGFHDPVLRMIPEADIIRHLHKMTMLLDQWFPGERNKKGIWLSASEWETDFPRVLQESGIDFTLLEESLFLASGIKPADLFKPYRTENLGKSVIVFPDHRIIARQILGRKTSEIIGSFRAIANRPDVQILPLSFSAPPFLGTSPEWYTPEQLDSWFEVLQTPWIETHHLVDLVHEDYHYPVCYLSPGCSPDVAVRLLPPDAKEAYERCFQDLRPRFDFERFKPFLHGGNWNGVFSNFPEVQHLQKKMLWLRDLVHDLKDPSQHRKAETLLLSSQHYNPFLEYPRESVISFPFRNALHQKLIKVEKILSAENRSLSFQRRDYDGDGFPEIRMGAAHLSLILKPSEGGSIIDLCHLGREWNLTNTLTRHRHLSAHGTKNPSIQDWHPRRLFQEHFIKAPISIQDAESMDYVELGDFTKLPYRVLDEIRATEEIQIRMKREGGIYLEGEHFPVTILKNLSMTAHDEIKVDYEIVIEKNLPMAPLFGVELNLATFDPLGNPAQISLGEQKGSASDRLTSEGASQAQLEHPKIGWKANLDFTPTTLAFHYPIHLEIPQGSSLMLLWRIPMKAQETFRFQVKMKL
jgi:hypothetical protein